MTAPSEPKDKRSKEGNGLFVIIEGIDGSGKSTLLAEVANALSALSPLLLREPTSGLIGQRIRKALSSKAMLDQSSWLNLFIEDRQENIDQNVLPALAGGKLVLQDRYFYSTAAYQGGVGEVRETEGNAEGARKKSAEEIVRMHEGFPIPDLIFYLKIDPGAALDRITRSRAAPEIFEQLPMLQRIASAYDRILPDSTIILDATAPLEENVRSVSERIRAAYAKT